MRKLVLYLVFASAWLLTPLAFWLVYSVGNVVVEHLAPHPEVTWRCTPVDSGVGGKVVYPAEIVSAQDPNNEDLRLILWFVFFVGWLPSLFVTANVRDFMRRRLASRKGAKP